MSATTTTMKTLTPILAAVLIQSVLFSAHSADAPKPALFTNSAPSLSQAKGSKSITCRLSHLDTLGTNETAAVYIFLCRTNGPTLTESLLAAPPKDPVSQLSVLVNADGVLAYDGEVVKAESKERVGYRFLATRSYSDSWDAGDNGITLGLRLDDFVEGMGKPEWVWFGGEVKVKAALVGLRRGEFEKERHAVVSRFLAAPTEATFRTKDLEVGK